MALTLLRHTTPAIRKGVCYGRTDLDLAPSFETECADVLGRVPRPDQIVSSPLKRCRILAERLGQAWGQTVTILEDWIEMDFGRWEAVPWDDIPRGELDNWAADFRGYSGYGGESVEMLENRIRRALSQLAGGTLVVTHAGCIKAACAIGNRLDTWNTQTAFGHAVRFDHPM